MAMPGERGQGGRRPHGWPCYDEQRRPRSPGAPAATHHLLECALSIRAALFAALLFFGDGAPHRRMRVSRRARQNDTLCMMLELNAWRHAQHVPIRRKNV